MLAHRERRVGTLSQHCGAFAQRRVGTQRERRWLCEIATLNQHRQALAQRERRVGTLNQHGEAFAQRERRGLGEVSALDRPSESHRELEGA